MARVAVVTGGTRGIGKAISIGLKEKGCKVAATYAGNDEAAAAFKSETGIDTFKWDVSSFEACGQGLKDVEGALGPVDILINNAGITRDGMFHKMSDAQWGEVIDADLTSAFNMSRHVIEGMRERGFGRIINVSSINGRKGQLGQVNYSAAKAGMIGFARALAQENARKGVTVNVVAPGYIDTDMVAAMSEKVLESIVAGVPVGRLGKPEEIAHCVNFLVDDHAGFITGAVIDANGGQFMG
ncbi:MAG: acetoacetyl-CoA reductase [Pseudomonadota bacterium]